MKRKKNVMERNVIGRKKSNWNNEKKKKRKNKIGRK